MNDFRAFLTFVLIACLSGCGGLLTKPENVPIAKLTAGYTTLKFIEQAEPDKRQERRERIRSIATDVQSLAKSDEQATVPALDTLVRSKVPWDKLSPSDTLLANALIETIENELMARVGNSTIPRDQMLVVFEVMQWVIDATKMGEVTQ
jgi:hypothetical protein